MKKVAAVMVSLGVILVIVGLVMVGIFGGEAIKNMSWKDIFSLNSHNLNDANYSETRTAEELAGLKHIKINTDRYSVYVLPTDQDEMSVKYVTPLEDGVDVAVTFVDNDTLVITEKDSLHSGWNWIFTSKRFIAVYLPQTEMFANASLTTEVKEAIISVQDNSSASLDLSARTGSVTVKNSNIDGEVRIKTTTGAVVVDNLTCDDLKAETDTGAVTVSEANVTESINIIVDTGSVNCNVVCSRLRINTDTGSVKFNAFASNIIIKTDTGSVSGVVVGHKSLYEIVVHKDTGSSNLSNQHVIDAEKSLSVEVDTGSIHVRFSDN